MPVFRSSTVLATVKNIKAFLTVEAGITRSDLTESGWVQGISQRPDARGEVATKEARVKPENMVWIFSYGSGRSGTTWVTNILRSLDGYSLWKSPRVGSLFGEFYYDNPASERNVERTEHILGPAKETWLKPLRSFVLESAALRYPEVAAPGSDPRYLVISDHHGSLGAPLIMEAFPESRMILMMRDPRDVAASTREASRASGWVRKAERTLADINPMAFMEAHVEQNARSMGHSWQAYDAHRGPKTVLRYEDLRSDTVSAMEHTLSTLGLGFDKAGLARVVEAHSWENVPEEKKGEGKFYRKATPGSWREDLTPDEVRVVEDAFAPLLKEFYADVSIAG